jgi:hypothetical protein
MGIGSCRCALISPDERDAATSARPRRRPPALPRGCGRAGGHTSGGSHRPPRACTLRAVGRSRTAGARTPFSHRMQAGAVSSGLAPLRSSQALRGETAPLRYVKRPLTTRDTCQGPRRPLHDAMPIRRTTTTSAANQAAENTPAASQTRAGQPGFTRTPRPAPTRGSIRSCLEYRTLISAAGIMSFTSSAMRFLGVLGVHGPGRGHHARSLVSRTAELDSRLELDLLRLVDPLRHRRGLP